MTTYILKTLIYKYGNGYIYHELNFNNLDLARKMKDKINRNLNHTSFCEKVTSIYGYFEKIIGIYEVQSVKIE